MGITDILLSILVYGLGLSLLIHEFFTKSNPDYQHIAGGIVILVFFAVIPYNRCASLWKCKNN